jgi:YycE-like N-terminal domain/YycE-like C-terminal domain
LAVNDPRPDRWAAYLPLRQPRFARPTSRVEAVVHFYRVCLGLDALYRFEDHAGHDVVMLGLPGRSYHLERTHRAGIDGTATTTENLLMLSLGTASAPARVVARFTDSGHQPVEAENPLSAAQDAVTFDNPDGWHLVLVPGPGL